MNNLTKEISNPLERLLQRETPIRGEIARPDLMQKYQSSGLPMPTPQQQRAYGQAPEAASAGVEDMPAEDGATALAFDPGQPNFFNIASLENALFPATKQGGLLTPEEQLGMPEFERGLWGAVDKRGRPKDTLGIARFERGLWPTGWEY